MRFFHKVEGEFQCTPFSLYQSIVTESLAVKGTQTGSSSLNTEPTHAQWVLDVDEPAIEAIGVRDLDQPISSCAVGLLPRQEQLAHLTAFLPLCDEGA